MMKPLLAAMVLACLLAFGVSGWSIASPLKKLSFSQAELFRANPQAPELYQDMARLFRVAEQEAIARLLPPRTRHEVIAAPALIEPLEPDTARDEHNI